MEADRQRVVLRIGQQVGGGLEDGLQELSRLVLVAREEGFNPARHVRLGPVGDHLDGVGQQLALTFQLHDVLGVEDLVERDFLGQCVPPCLEPLNVDLPLSQKLVGFVLVELAALDAQRLAGLEVAATTGQSRLRSGCGTIRLGSAGSTAYVHRGSPANSWRM